MEESPYTAPQAQLRDDPADSADDETLDPAAYITKLFQMNYGSWTIIKKGAERGITKQFTESILTQLHEEKLAAIRRGGWIRLIIGGAMCLFGVAAMSAGRFAWGAVVFGGLLAAQGFMHLRSPMPTLDDD